MRWWRRRAAGIRVQATVAAAGVVALTLLASAVLMLLLQQRALVSTLQDSVTALVEEDARTLSEGGVAALQVSEADRGQDTTLVQVTDATGAVVYSSRSSRQTQSPALHPAPGETVVTGRNLIPRFGELSDPLVVARGVMINGQPFVVTATSSQEAQEEAVTTTGLLLAVGIPLITVVVAAVTWWRIGRALGSVDRIRERVEEIEAANLSERVPVPATHDEVAYLATTMNEMLARLETSDARQRQFVADASHELRSPLTTMSATVDVAGADETGHSWQDLTPILRAETTRMSRLVEDLLNLSRLDNAAGATGSSTLVSDQDVDLDDLADQAARRARQVSPLTITTDLTPVKVLGEEHQLEQVLRNIVDNATAAAESSVRITVSCNRAHARVDVDDDGPGIAEADRERVFERFVRLDESRSRSSGGSGLGLAISQRIVQRHHGELTVGRSPLGGARFTLTLPASTT